MHKKQRQTVHSFIHSYKEGASWHTQVFFLLCSRRDVENGPDLKFFLASPLATVCKYIRD